MSEAIKSKKSQSINYSIDTVRAYLQQIGKIPLLTLEQELILGTQIRAMMTLLEKKKAEEAILKRQLNLTEWANLVQMNSSEINKVIKIGQQAKQKMIEANLRLVVTVAQKYQKRGLDFLDLIQEGNLGLEQGVEKFDPTKGYKLSTYAYWWIRQAITRAIAQKARTVRLPVHITEKINKIKKTRRELSQSVGRDATVVEIAKKLDITSEQIQEYFSVARQPVSLDLRIKEEGTTELSEFIEDKKSISPEDYVNRQFLQKDLSELMSGLTSQEKEIILLRFGFNGEKELSLAEIGKRMNLSRERIRQIEKKAITQLRAKRGKFREYINGKISRV